MEIFDKVLRQWMDSVYVTMLEVTGNGAYQYDAKLMTDSLNELAEEMDKESDAK